jgi:hypothetical protein
LHGRVRAAQDLVEAGAEHGDVARDASVMIAGDYGNFEARKEPRPTEIRTIRWQLLSSEQDDRVRVSPWQIMLDSSAVYTPGLGEI